MGAGAVRGVEAEGARLELLQEGAVLRTGELLAEQLVDVVVGQEHAHQALAARQRQLGGLRDARAVLLAELHAVDDDVDVVLLVALEVGIDGLVEGLHLAVEAHPREALLLEVLEELPVLALTAAHERCEQHGAGPGVALEHAVDDLARRLPFDAPPALRAVRHAGAREQQAQVVVDLGDRANGGTWVVAGRLLVDADRRREPLDGVDVGLVHDAEELPRVGGQALDVTALAFGVDGVEGERGLTGTRDSREDDEGVAGKLQVDALEVVLTGAADNDVLQGASCWDRPPGGGAAILPRGILRRNGAPPVATTGATPVATTRVERNSLPDPRSSARWRGMPEASGRLRSRPAPGVKIVGGGGSLRSVPAAQAAFERS